jgi:tRNA (cmo5U34)-methyltransferase
MRCPSGCTSRIGSVGDLRLGWNYFRDPDGNSIDKPSSLAEQLAWLAEAGVVGVDCQWLLAGHAIFGGRKP